MTRFVKFPGTSGSYASTDDVNLLDADTAHIAQSIGQWIPFNAVNVTQATPPAVPPFGTEALRVELNSASSSARAMSDTLGAGNGVAVLPSTTYTVPVSVYTDVPNRNFRVTVRDYDAAGVEGNSNLVSIDLTAGVWTPHSVPLTTASDAAFLIFETRWGVTGGGTPASGEVWWQNAHAVKEGTDPTFVPSLRIVGDLEAEWDQDSDDFAGSQVIYSRNNGADTPYQHQWSSRTPQFTRVPHSTINGPSDFGVDGRHTYKEEYLFATGQVLFYRDGNLIFTSAAGASEPLDGSTPALALEVGAAIGGTVVAWAGDLFSLSIRDGIDGPVVRVFDPDDIML